MKIIPFNYNGYLRFRARPLSLKEVLRLRDGLETPKTYPIQTHTIPNLKKILLVLN